MDPSLFLVGADSVSFSNKPVGPSSYFYLFELAKAVGLGGRYACFFCTTFSSYLNLIYYSNKSNLN
jgi:hypothetical protein